LRFFLWFPQLFFGMLSTLPNHPHMSHPLVVPPATPPPQIRLVLPPPRVLTSPEILVSFDQLGKILGNSALGSLASPLPLCFPPSPVIAPRVNKSVFRRSELSFRSLSRLFSLIVPSAPRPPDSSLFIRGFFLFFAQGDLSPRFPLSYLCGKALRVLPHSYNSP